MRDLAEKINNEGLGYFLIHYSSPDNYIGEDEDAKDFLAVWQNIRAQLELLDYYTKKHCP